MLEAKITAEDAEEGMKLEIGRSVAVVVAVWSVAVVVVAVVVVASMSFAFHGFHRS